MRDKEAQERYFQERSKGASQRKAAKRAGISRATAVRAEQDPRLKTEMAEALAKVGVTSVRIAQKVSDLMDAKKTVSAVAGKEAGAGTVDFVDVPDNQVQLKAAELAGKFRGDFTEKVEHSGQIAVVETVNFSAIAEVAPKLGKP